MLGRRLVGRPGDREILRLAAPALGELAAEPLYVLVDTAIVGHLGTPQLGGLAVAGTILTTAFALLIFLSYGTTAAVARSFGAGDAAAAAGHAVQALWFAGAVGLALVAAGLAWSPALGAAPTVTPYALVYLRVSLAGVPAMLVTLVGLGYLRGLQDTRTPLLIAAAANAGNLVLELVLVYGVRLGVAGSALATVAAQMGSAAVYLVLVVRRVRAAGARVRPHGHGLGVFAARSGALFVRTAALRGAFTGATAVAAGIGTTALAAHQVAFQVWTFLALVLDAVAIAGQAMVGRLLGAGDGPAARAAARRMVEWGVAFGLLFALAVALARPLAAGLFTSDPAVRAQAGQALWYVAALQPVGAVVFVLDGVLIGAGDLRFLAAASVAVNAALFLPAAWAVSRLGLGLGALWGALTLLMLGRLASNGWRFAGGRWQVEGPGRKAPRPPA